MYAVFTVERDKETKKLGNPRDIKVYKSKEAALRNADKKNNIFKNQVLMIKYYVLDQRNNQIVLPA